MITAGGTERTGEFSVFSFQFSERLPSAFFLPELFLTEN